MRFRVVLGLAAFVGDIFIFSGRELKKQIGTEKRGKTIEEAAKWKERNKKRKTKRPRKRKEGEKKERKKERQKERYIGYRMPLPHVSMENIESILVRLTGRFLRSVASPPLEFLQLPGLEPRKLACWADVIAATL